MRGRVMMFSVKAVVCSKGRHRGTENERESTHEKSATHVAVERMKQKEAKGMKNDYQASLLDCARVCILQTHSYSHLHSRSH
jgi:hypothetical protein